MVIKEQNYDKWKLLTLSAWTNSINAATGGIGILVSNKAYNAIANVEMISPRIMIAHFQGNLSVFHTPQCFHTIVQQMLVTIKKLNYSIQYLPL